MAGNKSQIEPAVFLIRRIRNLSGDWAMSVLVRRAFVKPCR
jgi:hypothetical protein